MNDYKLQQKLKEKADQKYQQNKSYYLQRKKGRKPNKITNFKLSQSK